VRQHQQAPELDETVRKEKKRKENVTIRLVTIQKSTTKQIPLYKRPVTEGVAFAAAHRTKLIKVSRFKEARLSLGHLWMAMTNFLGDCIQAGPFVEAQSNAGFRWPHAEQVIELSYIDALETADYTNVPVATDV
jgi:hypothetical protein